MQNIIIRYRKNFFMIAGTTALACTAVFILLYLYRMKDISADIDLLRAVYFVLGLGSALVAIRCYIIAFSKKIVMAIVQQGIIDYINLEGAQIPWNNVLRAELIYLGSQPALAVFVNNHHELLKPLKKIKHRVATAKIEKTGTPIILSTRLYDYNPQEIINLINKRACGETGG